MTFDPQAVLKDGKTECWNCGGVRYRESTAVEECLDCKIKCDYHSSGTNEAWRRAKEEKDKEEERIEYLQSQREWDEENDTDYQEDDDY